MKRIATPAALVLVAVLLQTLLPDRAIWHAGWYGVALLCCCVWLVASARSAVRFVPARARAGVLAVMLGACVVAFAGIANGLFAPDPQLVIGAPGASESVAGLGTIAFPALGGGAPRLASGGYAASFELRDVPRSVVAVDAFDSSGAHLTVTQPTGSVFSSPVLLMEERQRISGLDLPFDSFAVPAAHRIVKAVLFDARQAALLRGAGGSQPAVLFAVDDATDEPLPNAIRLDSNGAVVAVGGLRLRARVTTYDAVEVLSIPSLYALVAGALLILAGGALSFRTR